MEQKMVKVPFWVQITCILLCGVIVSGIVYWELSDAKIPKHTVTFAWPDGSVIEEKKVKEGKGVVPPKLEVDSSQVFCGWSKSFNQVYEDREVHPSFYSINDENLFYFNSVCVREGDSFNIPVFLGGTVNLSEAKLSITYDPEVLQLKQVSGSDCASAVATEDGCIELQIISENKHPILEKMQIATISFKSLKKNACYTELLFACSDPMTITAGVAVPGVGTTLNNKIYFLQEVN